MELFVNGQPQDLPEAITVAVLVSTLGLPERGVAVAVDEAVVPRGRWGETALTPKQRVEVLTAVQGG